MNKKNQNQQYNLTKTIIVIVVAIIFGILGIEKDNIQNILGDNLAITNSIKEATSFDKIQIETGNSVISNIQNKVGNRVYFFDVGQADSILVVNNGKTMLIDAGNNDDGDLIVKNIKKLGISKIDYLIGTHPHEDHIGGLDNVINTFEIGNIFMPKVKTNTKTFEDVLDAISNKGLKVKTPKIGDTFDVGDAKCEVMSIGEDTENLNETSIVIRMEYNDVSYLFTGDMEVSNESARNWPQTDILKVAHHGSSTSTSANFLKQIMPKIAIIQVGENNKYGHPHDVIIKRLKNIGAEIYRNDEKQTILIIQE